MAAVAPATTNVEGSGEEKAGDDAPKAEEAGATATVAVKPAPTEFASQALKHATFESAMDEELNFDRPWQKPNVDEAKQHRSQSMFYRGEAPLWGTSLDKDLRKMGIGIDLYFRSLKWFTIVFVVMSILSAPALFLSVSGQRYTTEELDPLGFAKFTLGNNGFPAAGLSNGTAVVVNETKTVIFDTEVSSQDVAYIISASDFFATLFLLCFALFYSARVKILADEIDEDVVSTEDYSVFVHGLPSDATEQEIAKHFSDLYPMDKPDHEFKGSCACLHIGGKKSRAPPKTWDGEPLKPVTSVKNTGKSEYKGLWVADVSIAEKRGAAIRKYLAKKKLLSKVHEAKVKVQKFSPQSTATANPGKLAAAQAKLAKVEAKLQKVQAKTAVTAASCEGAFVVFNYEIQKDRCLADYHNSKSTCRRGFMSPQLLFRGQHRLQVELGPEPDNVIWENIEVKGLEVCLRRTVTNLVVVLLLVLSLYLLFQAQQAKSSLGDTLPSSDVCTYEVPATFYGSYQFPDGAEIRRGSTEDDAECGANQFWLEVFDPATGETILPENTTSTNSTMNSTSADPCQDFCTETAPAGTCSKISGDGVYLQKDRVACFCLTTLVDLISDRGVWAGAQDARDLHGDLCTDVAAKYVTAQSLLVSAALAVVIINTVLKSVLKALANFERHDTVSGQQTAVTIKIFLAQLLNTGVIVLVVNAKLPNDATLPIQGTGLFEGQYSGFTAQWHVTVGVSLIITMAANIFVPHSAPLAKLFVIEPLKRCCLRSRKGSQRALNKLYAPHHYNVGADRYPFVLNTLFVTLGYSSGLPILLPMAAVSFLLFYWVDKLLVLRLYERPARLDAKLAMLVSRLLPIAIIVHLGMAIWFLGESDVLKSGTLNAAAISGSESVANAEAAYEEWRAGVEEWDMIGFFPKVVRSNVMPLFLLLVFVLVFYFIIANMFAAIKKLLVTVFHALTCGKCAHAEEQFADLDDRAVFAGGVAYTGDYKVLVLVHDLKQKKVKGKVVPLDTEANNKHREAQAAAHLTEDEASEGWDLIKEYDESDPARLKHAVKVKRWLEDGAIHGVEHKAGQIKKTWQIMAETGLHTFNILANHKYKEAVYALVKRQNSSGLPTASP